MECFSEEELSEEEVFEEKEDEEVDDGSGFTNSPVAVGTFLDAVVDDFFLFFGAGSTLDGLLLPERRENMVMNNDKCNGFLPPTISCDLQEYVLCLLEMRNNESSKSSPNLALHTL
jgi:hypothetical protein